MELYFLQFADNRLLTLYSIWLYKFTTRLRHISIKNKLGQTGFQASVGVFTDENN